MLSKCGLCLRLLLFLFIHLCAQAHTHAHICKHCVILSNVKWGVGIGYLIVLVLFYVMYANMPGRATKAKWMGSIWLMRRSTTICLSAKTCIFYLFRERKRSKKKKIACVEAERCVSLATQCHTPVVGILYSQLNKRIYEWYGWPDDEKILYIIFWSFCVFIRRTEEEKKQNTLYAIWLGDWLASIKRDAMQSPTWTLNIPILWNHKWFLSILFYVGSLNRNDFVLTCKCTELIMALCFQDWYNKLLARKLWNKMKNSNVILAINLLRKMLGVDH